MVRFEFKCNAITWTATKNMIIPTPKARTLADANLFKVYTVFVLTIIKNIMKYSTVFSNKLLS
ncbi:hypothetical protein AWA1501_24990 [Lactiplantibacillus pentosus]|nr:hypothetical protein AWA1501_24990 [Lactiplantibacillus pentosus]